MLSPPASTLYTDWPRCTLVCVHSMQSLSLHFPMKTLSRPFTLLDLLRWASSSCAFQGKLQRKNYHAWKGLWSRCGLLIIILIPVTYVVMFSWQSLNDKSSLIVRESAAASIIAAQLVLRDETHLFALLDGLADEKKNLLTYLFDKHGVRGLTASNGNSGMDKLEKEIRRLDTRTNTPSRFNAV